MEVGQLEATLELNYAQFTKGMRASDDQMRSFASGAEKVFGDLAREVAASFSGLGNDLKAFGATSAQAMNQFGSQVDGALGRVSQGMQEVTQGVNTMASQVESGMRTLANAVGQSMDSLVNEMRQFNAEQQRVREEAQRTEQAQASASQQLQRMETGFGMVASGATKVAATFGAVALSIGALLAMSIQQASQMEQFAARLETVQKSATRAQRTLEEAVKYAAVTPFNVQGVVEATVQLEVYGATASKVLPLVGNLAAGMGRSIEETALVVGKAWSGSLEGFEALRNTYGLSISELKRLGGAVDSQGQIMAKTTEDINKNRNALVAYIQTNFAGAVERQANTFQGALSNFTDSLQRLGASVGKVLLPMATAMARFATSVVEMFEKLGPTFTTFVAVAAVAATGVATLIAGFAGLVAVGASVAASIVGIASYVGGAVGAMAALEGIVTLTQVAFIGLESALAPVGAALAALTSPFAIFIGMLGSVYVAWTQIQKALAGEAVWDATGLEASEKKVQLALQQESAEIQRTRGQWRQFRDALNEVAQAHGQVFVDSNKSAEAVANLQNLIKNLPKSEVAAKLQSLGLDQNSLTKNMEAATSQAQSYQTELKELMDLRAQVAKTGASPENTVVSLASAPTAAKALGKNSISGTELEQRFDELTKKMNEANKAASVFRSIIEQVFNPLGTSFDRIDKEVRGIKDFLDFSDKLGGVVTYQQKLGEIEKRIGNVRAELGKVGLPTTQQGAMDYLKPENTQATPEGTERVKEYLNLLAVQQATVKKYDEDDKKQRQERINAVKEELDRRAQLEDVSIQDRIAAQQQILAIAKGSKDLEVQANHELAVLNKQLRDQDTMNLKDSFKEQLAASKDFLSRMKALRQLSPEDELAGLDRMRAAIRKFMDDNKAMLKEPKNKGFLNDLLNQDRGLQVESAGVVNEAYDRNYQQMKRASENFFADQAVGSKQSAAQQIRDIDSVLTYWRSGKSSIRPDKLNGEVENLERKRAQLVFQNLQEEKDRAIDANNTRLMALQSSMKALEDERAAGKANHAEIVANLNEQLQLKMRNIQLAAQKELDYANLTADQIAQIQNKADVQRLDLLREHRRVLKGMLDDQQGGLKDLQAKFGDLKSLAGQAKPQEKTSAFDQFGANTPRFGDTGGSTPQQEAADLVKIIGQSTMDRNAFEQAREGLLKRGVILTANESMAGQRTADGKTYATIDQARKELGLGGGATSDSAALRDELTKTEDAIKELSKSVGDGGLKTSIDDLTAAIRGTDVPGSAAAGAAAVAGGVAADATKKPTGGQDGAGGAGGYTPFGANFTKQVQKNAEDAGRAFNQPSVFGKSEQPAVGAEDRLGATSDRVVAAFSSSVARFSDAVDRFTGGKAGSSPSASTAPAAGQAAPGATAAASDTPAKSGDRNADGSYGASLDSIRKQVSEGTTISAAEAAISGTQTIINVNGIEIGGDAKDLLKKFGETQKRRANTSMSFDPTGGVA